jgi:pimeloyl-ACP methyl ester carboxylesterase
VQALKEDEGMFESALLPFPALAANDLPAEGWGDSVFTWLGSAVDAALVQAMRLVVDAILLPQPDDLPALQLSALPFVVGELAEEPRRYFDFVDAPLAPLEVSERRRRALAGGAVIARRFTTEYRPHPAVAELVGAVPPEGDRLRVDHWAHEPRRPHGTVIALHGFTMGNPRIDSVALFADALYRRGLDVALVTLPFHGRRTPPEARFSGQRFAVANVAQLNEAVRQSVYEVHLLSRWLRQHADGPVGVLGLSLGGYIAALMAGLSDELDFVVPMVPPACFGDLAWRFFQRSRRAGEGEAPSLTLEQLRFAYRVHSPLNYPLRLPRERAFIVAGRGDQIVPAEHPHALWRHWGQPDIHWFSGSHLAPFGRGRLIRAVGDHIEACCRG